MLDLFFSAFVIAFLVAGMRRPFMMVLAYIYIDVVAPQKIAWGFLTHVPISLIAFGATMLGWLLADDKSGIRLSWRQGLMLLLLVDCFLTTRAAQFPEAAAAKWDWVWKALVFAIFLPFPLRTRLRIEAMALVMVLGVAVIVIGGAMKTLASGGGYGELKLLVNDNTGLYEGSILSTVAVGIVPLIVWLARFGTVFRPGWPVWGFAAALIFACLLIPVGTEARTGLICIGVLALLLLRNARRRLILGAGLGLAVMMAMPFLPKSFTERMDTIRNHSADQSASTRVAVWQWTMDFAREHPFGGGFNAFLGDEVRYEKITATTIAGNVTRIERETVTERARAYHSSYFEMLGEQGYPGLALWLLLHLSGVVAMERLRWRFAPGRVLGRGAGPPADTGWIAPLAEALQAAQVIYLFGAAFVGIAFQPFCYMLVGLQCGLAGYAHRLGSGPVQPFVRVRGGGVTAPAS